MKKCVLCLTVMVLLTTALVGDSRAQCPQDTVDRGECDSLNVVCLDCEVDTTTGGPYFVRFPMLVTHDQTEPTDSIAGFVIPISWTRTNPTKYCSLSAYWNASSTLYLFPDFPRSVFRHMLNLSDPTDTLMHNRMAQIAADFSNRDWDTRIVDVSTLDAYGRMSLVATGSQDQKWWAGNSVLLATFTFKTEDTMQVCIDTTFWPPDANLAFVRSDSKEYVPRDNLPSCFFVGAQQPNFIIEAEPDTQIVGVIDSASYTATLTSLFGFDSPCTLDVAGLPAGATADFTLNPVIPTDSSSMKVVTSGITPGGIYDLTITATELTKAQTQHTAQVVLVVSGGDVIRVPQDQPTIQLGIDAAQNGDTVLVAPGTYYEHINFNGKAIVVTSEAEAENTIIDRLYNNIPIVTFNSGEDTNSVLDGFTVRNANDAEAGILCDGASPLIKNNIVADHVITVEGGAIACLNSSSAMIVNNVISANTAEWSSGGIYCRDAGPTIAGNSIFDNTFISGFGIWTVYPGSPVITDNSIFDNTASQQGGGIYCNSSGAEITGNTIMGNSSLYGGGICCASGSGVIANNFVSSNSISSWGAGILIDGGWQYTITGNTIILNTFLDEGAGIYCNSVSESCTLSFNLISGNVGDIKFAGIACDQSSPSILNNTVASNIFGGAEPGGIVCFENSDPTITNNIISDNDSAFGIHCSGGSVPTISYNDVWSNDSGNYYGCVPGVGSISANPLFCDPQDFDYTLHIYSPCLGTGEGGADMGAFGMGCEGDLAVNVVASPDTTGLSGTQVAVDFYVENTGFVAETYDVSVSDSLGWTIYPTYHEVFIDSGLTDTVSFSVTIPVVSTETTDRIFVTATSQTDPAVWDSASLTVTAYVQDWEVTSGGDVGGASNSQATVVFYIENTGFNPDSCHLHVSDSMGWDIQPEDYQLILNPSQQDSVFFDIQIPSVPVGTTDKVTLTAVSLSNPFIADSAWLLVTCDSYNVTITEISDIGNDQGKQVRIDWSSFPGDDPVVTHFTIFRRIDPLLHASFSFISATLSSEDYPPGDWEMIDSYPAYGETLYSATAPTLKDSTIAEEQYWSVFFIRAGTDDPTVYFDSPVDSGYSLDNLSPSPPIGLFASHEPPMTKLTWNATTAVDFDYYTVYGGTDSGFTPAPDNRLGYTVDTTFADSTAELGIAYYYLASATDFSGNESDPSNEAMGVRYVDGDANSDGIVNVGDVVYLVAYLYRNGPAPNPSEAGDANCDGTVDVGDVVYLVNYLYRGGDPPGCP